MRSSLILAGAIVAAAAIIGVAVRGTMLEQTRMQLEAQAAIAATTTAQSQATAAVAIAVQQDRQRRWETFLEYGPQLVSLFDSSRSTVHSMARTGSMINSGRPFSASEKQQRNDFLNSQVEDTRARECSTFIGTACSVSRERAEAVAVPPEANAFKQSVIGEMMGHETRVMGYASLARVALERPLRAEAFDDILKEPLGTDRVLPQLLALCTRLEVSDRECMAVVKWERLTTN